MSKAVGIRKNSLQCGCVRSLSLIPTARKRKSQPCQVEHNLNPEEQPFRSLEVQFGDSYDHTIDLQTPIRVKHPRPECKYNRAKMLDWMLEVLAYFPTCRTWDCYFHCAGVFDRYLSAAPSLDVKEIHLIGITCLFIGMKVTTFRHPLLKELLRDACAHKFSIEQVTAKEASILKQIDYQIQPAVLSKPLCRINSHCLVQSIYRQNGVSPATTLQLCFEKLVLVSFDATTEAEYSNLELAYSLLSLVLNEMIEKQLTTHLALRKVLTTVKLTFELDTSRIEQCRSEILGILRQNKLKFDPSGECFYNSVVLETGL